MILPPAVRCRMFKWCCLAAGVLFGLVLAWMVNDLRQEVRRSVDTVNKDLPQIVEKSRQVADVVHGHLPELLEKTKKTSEAVSAVAEDVQQLRKLLGLPRGGRDETLVAYMDGVLEAVEQSGGTIGLKKVLGKGLDDPVPAREWVARARRTDALSALLLAGSRGDFLRGLGRSAVLKRIWYIQVGGREPVPLVDWVKANHPGSKDVEVGRKGDTEGE